VRLTEVFRQAAESRIIVNAHRINHGLMPDLAPLYPLIRLGPTAVFDRTDAHDRYDRHNGDPQSLCRASPRSA
jgi:hypothetical protein